MAVQVSAQPYFFKLKRLQKEARVFLQNGRMKMKGINVSLMGSFVILQTVAGARVL